MTARPLAQSEREEDGGEAPGPCLTARPATQGEQEVEKGVVYVTAFSSVKVPW